MDALCASVGNLSIHAEMVLNPESTRDSAIDNLGIYFEIITAHHEYRIYDDGRVYASVGGAMVFQRKTLIISTMGSDMYVTLATEA